MKVLENLTDKLTVLKEEEKSASHKSSETVAHTFKNCWGTRIIQGKRKLRVTALKT